METLEDRFPFLFNKQADYNTNSKSYYDQLAKYNKVLQILAKMIEEYDVKLDNSLENINTVLTNYTTMLDGKLAGFDDSVMLLLREWIDDGTFEMIINTEIFNHKLDTATFTTYKENADSVALSHSEQLADIVKRDIVKHYGAITTGESFPLSNKFGSLGEAQVKYPNVTITSLTQELNWAIFNQAFYDADANKFNLDIPSGNYYIKDPLKPIGTSQADKSIEFTNFSISGEGIGKTILIFDFIGDTTWAMDVVINTSKMNIGGFTIKNKKQKQGCGLRINGLFSGNVYDILSIYFYIGADIKTYISEVKNVTAGYCSCGIIWRNGTSTSIQNCYASNTIKRDSNDNEDWSGVGHYIIGYIYSTFSNLAADNCQQPYKISGTSAVRTKLLNCGMEQGTAASAIYVNNPKAYVSIDGFSIDGIGSIANIQNVGSIEFNNLTDMLIHNLVRGTNVTPGQVRINGRLLTTTNALLMKETTPTINQGLKAVEDLAYDVINYSAGNFFQNGRGIVRGNEIEFQIKLTGNGQKMALKFDVMPYQFYGSQEAPFNAGTVFISGFNNGGITFSHYKSTDGDISVTITKVDDYTRNVLIQPFANLNNPTAHKAIFEISAYYNSDSKDQNIKENRIALRIKGIDY